MGASPEIMLILNQHFEGQGYPIGLTAPSLKEVGTKSTLRELVMKKKGLIAVNGA